MTSSKKSFQYDYPRPAVTVDAIITRKATSITEVLLIKRRNEPFAGHWALPGGFVDENEDLIDACRRELIEETGIVLESLEQLYAVGTPFRDPRGHTISIVFYSNVEYETVVTAGDDASEAQWFSIKNLPAMAFDHKEILCFYLKAVVNQSPT